MSIPTKRKIYKIQQREVGSKCFQRTVIRAKLTDEQKESLCDILEEDCTRTIHCNALLYTFATQYNSSGQFQNGATTLKIYCQEEIFHELSKNSSGSTKSFFYRRNRFSSKHDLSVRSRAHRSSSHKSRSGIEASKLLCCLHDVL
ncbi:hypothetical protein RF11_16370 [Thelohanellus kitauei]|uniref:Uncharacterized protein n=1 Tax=Thelohanellus kitauei TaxID=669202 RepID=A0A0C2J3C3_THEKT|nr:hypothetical protein RF11_16370 [Thelohanellus kitauei]